MFFEETCSAHSLKTEKIVTFDASGTGLEIKLCQKQSDGELKLLDPDVDILTIIKKNDSIEKGPVFLVTLKMEKLLQFISLTEWYQLTL